MPSHAQGVQTWQKDTDTLFKVEEEDEEFFGQPT